MTLGLRFADGSIAEFWTVAAPGVALVPASVGLPSEYCTASCAPLYSCEAKSTEFARRKLKPEGELLLTLRITLFGETKLPLPMPRKPSVSPNLLNGVSMLPSLRVHQLASRPTKDSRLLTVLLIQQF